MPADRCNYCQQPRAAHPLPHPFDHDFADVSEASVFGAGVFIGICMSGLTAASVVSGRAEGWVLLLGLVGFTAVGGLVLSKNDRERVATQRREEHGDV